MHPMYHRRDQAGAESREFADDDSKARDGQKRSERRDSNEQSPRQTNWAWAAATGHRDWMESHTPLAHYD
ncbi:hypothetical protein CNE_BB1p08700 (plasmid) [Cupriavidus necator N-1]|uniref:Uncharacterized protein n=1 Tax=Cupriavidus necator (strain ATCC 43291 / DSM 13513 / CCUG 52238 / LMG 8453 / N-1) TaxID=1042878 RepID=F8GU80_CUPNN|nr:hypothetical protein CNE_BB1p08700 [Cupriavidus necator N-1]